MYPRITPAVVSASLDAENLFVCVDDAALPKDMDPDPVSGMIRWPALVSHLAQALENHELTAIPKAEAEENAAYRQLATYVLLRVPVGREIWYASYRRSPKGGEGRLHGKLSIGIGGHVEVRDLHPERLQLYRLEECGWPFYSPLLRELREEIEFWPGTSRVEVLGGIRVSDDPVSTVHLGIVACVTMQQHEAVRLVADDSELLDFRFQRATDLRRQQDEMEVWSRIAFYAAMTTYGEA